MNVRKIIPLINAVEDYSFSHFKGDFSAGLTVGVMLIPQGMAYSMLAGLPPIYGLYASTVPLIIYAFLGTSRQLAVGPVAIVSLLIITGVGVVSAPGSPEYIALTILLALMVGIIQATMGLFRLGFLVNFLSHPVISGFTTAAAIIIGASQLKHLLGISLPRNSHITTILINTYSNLENVHLATLALGCGGIIVILLAKKINKSIPGPLVAVVLSILIVYGMNLHEQGIKIIKDIPAGTPYFEIPNINLDHIKLLLPIAITIAFVGFMESIAVAKAIQSKRKNYKVVPNSELTALGLANICGSFFQAFPTTGGFSRTAVNDQTGAQTGIASIISASLVLLTLLFLTPLFYYLPQSILASVIMVAVFGLIDITEAKHLWKTDRSDFYMFSAAFAGTLFVGIEEGIMIGVSLSIGVILYRSMKPHFAILGRVQGTNLYRNLNRFGDAEDRKDVLIVRFDARLYFANIAFFKEKTEALFEQKGSDLKLFVIEGQTINSIDSSGMHMLFELLEICRLLKVEMALIGLNGPVRDTLYRTGFVEAVGKNHFFNSTQQAIDCFDENPNLNTNNNEGSQRFQTNIVDQNLL